MNRLTPPDVSLTPVSPRLTSARLVTFLPWPLIAAVACGVLALVFTPWVWLGTAVGVLVAAWLGWLLPRQVRALGWAVTDTTLVVARGVLFRRVTIIPLGRLQYTEVERGPILNAFALARVTLHTASASTDGAIYGLPGDQATRLQQTLSRRGESHLMGL